MIVFFIFPKHTDLQTQKPTSQQRELKLIQSKADIENPIVSIRADKI